MESTIGSYAAKSEWSARRLIVLLWGNTLKPGESTWSFTFLFPFTVDAD